MNLAKIKLKELNAAYIASRESGYCPSPNEIDNVLRWYEVGTTKEYLLEVLESYQGSRTDEIANEISRTIIEL